MDPGETKVERTRGIVYPHQIDYRTKVPSDQEACPVVWIVDPKQKHITEFRSETSIRVFTVKDRLAASDVFGDWFIEVGKLFQ